MANDIKYRDILYNNQQIGPYPSDKLKRVDEPTVNIHLGPHENRSPKDRNGFLIANGFYGPVLQSKVGMFTISEPIGAAFTSVQRHLNEIRNNPVAEKEAPIPDDPRVRARHLKSLGYFLGADQVGICEVPEWSWLKEDDQGNPIERKYKYAIVLLRQKNLGTTRVADGYEWIFDPCSFQAYQYLACETETMANYIRRLGFEADVSNMFTYQNVMPPLILMAGLGESSKLSCMLNPFLGANMKAAAVLTNMEVEIDKPIDFGLQDYCAKCTICEEACMNKALTGKKIEFNGYEWWEMKFHRCNTFTRMNENGWACGRCTKMCPWNFENEHPAKTHEFWSTWDGSIEKLHARVDKHAEEIRARGFVGPDEKTDKWWFDLDKETRTSPLFIPPTTEQVDEDYYKQK